MSMESPQFFAPSPKKAEAPPASAIDFGDTLLVDDSFSPEQMIAHNVPVAAADKVERAKVVAEIARKKKLISDIDAYLSANSAELMRLSVEDQKDEAAFQARLEKLNEGSGEWIARGGELEEKVSRLERSIGVDKQVAASVVGKQPVPDGKGFVPDGPISRIGRFFSGVKDSVSGGITKLTDTLLRRRQSEAYSVDGFSTNNPPLEDQSEKVDIVSEHSDPIRHAKIRSEIERKTNLVHHIDEFLAKIVRDMHHSEQDVVNEESKARFALLNKAYVEWRRRSDDIEDKIADLKGMIDSEQPKIPDPVLPEMRKGFVSSIKEAVTGMWSGVLGKSQEGDDIDTITEKEISLSLKESDLYLGENPYPLSEKPVFGAETRGSRENTDVPSETVVSGWGALDGKPTVDPFSQVEYARSASHEAREVPSLEPEAFSGFDTERDRLEAIRLKEKTGFAPDKMGSVPSSETDFDSWFLEQQRKETVPSFGIDTKTLYSVAEMSAKDALEYVAVTRRAYEKAFEDIRMHPANAEALSAYAATLRNNYRDTLDAARKSLAQEIKSLSGDEKKARMQVFASVMQDLKKLDEKREESPSKPEEKFSPEERKAA